ncbi:MAG: helix-turn-helix domain containing protein [Rhodobacterales bacterium 65-51]|uniref:DUF6456 domain-containing protein n=1 Tax=uncultured Gemmobacter sp. TaxID=1095917 RepID=UPI000964ED07|nr:DUF6456 domain-containing protein [uncultured Gemmobacter sp.]OJY27121.1 MAG: helix-turn-helix domain containing protein [Rhodobacterales bacterium 65-51]
MEPNLSADFTLPAWLPDAVRLYLDHTEDGLSLRQLARREGLAASTVMRQVRRYEARRDDPLVDEALAALARAQGAGSVTPDPDRKDAPEMTAPIRPTPVTLDEAGIDREARRVLRRMAEPGAVMAIAPEMQKAAVLRTGRDGKMVQTAVLDRAVAQAFALKDWIGVRKQGRLTSYEITTQGRAALKRLVEEEDRRRQAHHGAFGLAETAAAFGTADPVEAEGSAAARRLRYTLTESPVAVLARRRDKDGRAFLEPELVQAAERLREDFELAQIGGRIPQGWDGFLPAGEMVEPRPGSAAPLAARDRVALALRDLGPGLGDVALRVCCHLEGLEVAEKRMGWAARSGKIVLRIALQRLRRHYDETYGRAGPLIG